MPYIEAKSREYLEPSSETSPLKPGPLNFQITRLLVQYQQRNGLSYQTINDIIGALEGAKLEYYRRVAVPYENSKMSLNGDVY
jgi:hypothetical protein